MKAAHRLDHEKHVDEIMDHWMGSWRDKWPEKNPKPARKKEVEAWEQRYRQEHEAYRLQVLPQAEERRASQLNVYDAPQVIWAWKMFHNSPNNARWPEASKKVMNHQVEIFDGPMTVQEINMAYRLDRISSATERIFHAGEGAKLLEALEQVARRLAGVHQEIAMQNQGTSGY